MIVLLVILLFSFIFALVLGLEFYYRRENSLLSKWRKEMTKCRETCR